MREALGVALLAVIVLLSAPPARCESALVLDGFEDPASWQGIPADGVELAVSGDAGFAGRALRLDIAFAGGGYAVVRRELSLDLPENYAFSFRVRGDIPPNHLEFKLVDATGENVWWVVQRDLEFSREWKTITVKKRHLRFAWGPLGGGEIRRVAAIEFAVTAGSGGRGTVWLDELEFRPLAALGAPLAPVAWATSAREGHEAAKVLDSDSTTWWQPAEHDAAPWIALDFQRAGEYGGITLDWRPGRHAADYTVEISDDGAAWRVADSVAGANGGRDYLFMPDAESGWVRVLVKPDQHARTVQLAEIRVQPLAWSETREAFFRALAADVPRGMYPRAIAGEQVYWTIAGVDGDSRQCLLSEDGMLETGKRSFSIEPFLLIGGRLVTWADARATASLEDGYLPIPSVTWEHESLRLRITALGTGAAGASGVLARYRVSNLADRAVAARLVLALRPFQVNPPAQFLNTPGGTAPLHDVRFKGAEVWVNGARAIRSLAEPAAFGAVTFHGGDVVTDHLRRGKLPAAAEVHDAWGAASGALAYDLDLAPHSEGEVCLWIPLYPDAPAPPAGGVAETGAWVTHALEEARGSWHERLDRVAIEIPDSTGAVVASLRGQLGWILASRAGPALQPGLRAYARSWIRDGALASQALLRMGHAGAARDFLTWYAGYQYPDGKIPCVVDARGADPTPEHDSAGEFIFLVAEYFRFTGDRELTARMWPRVLRAVDYLDSLRREGRDERFFADGRPEFYGLLPPSISHEGYSAKPMHSYWDDFFALRGFEDALYLAVRIGSVEERARLAKITGQFRHDVAASIHAAMARHSIDYVPGCADLGDFDATSTAIALTATGSAAVLPAAAMRRTFEKYWEFFVDRRDGAPWEAFTPYEVRTIGAFVRLGWRERAHELLDFHLAHQRPPAWRQWPEVVWKDARAPRFLGDLPHTWVGAEYVRSVLDMLAYERRDTETLVVGAGVVPEWLEGTGVAVADLATSYGPLTYTMRRVGEALEIHVGPGLRIPPGGVVIAPPAPWSASDLARDGEVPLKSIPATVVLLPGR